MKTLTKDDLEDYITGATIFGCGGGGSVKGGIDMIEDALKKNLSFRLADINELPSEELLCIIGWVGGGVSKEV